MRFLALSLFLLPLFTNAQTGGNVPAAGSTERFVDSIGVNTHLLYTDTGYSNGAFVASEVIKLGVKHVRDGSALAVSTTQYPNAYAAFLQMGAAGVRFAAGHGTTSRTNPHILNYSSTALQSAATLMSEGGHNYIEALEGSNEIDISGDTSWVADWSTNLNNLLTANTAGLPIYSPSLAYSGNFARLPQQKTSTVPVYGNLHGYAGNSMPGVLWPTTSNNTRKAFPASMPLVQTETGYYDATASGQGFVDDATQAKYIPRLLLESFRNGVYRTYLYELLDEISTWNPALQESKGQNTCVQCSYGLVTAHGLEKPAFTAVENLITVLSRSAIPVTTNGSLAYTITGGNTKLHQLLLQKSANVFDLVLWQEVSSFNTTTSVPVANQLLPIKLIVKASSITLYLPSHSQSAIPLTLINGQVALAVPDEAMIVEITRP